MGDMPPSGARHGADVEATAEARFTHQFRQRVGKATSAHIVNQADGIAFA